MFSYHLGRCLWIVFLWRVCFLFGKVQSLALWLSKTIIFFCHEDMGIGQGTVFNFMGYSFIIFYCYSGHAGPHRVRHVGPHQLPCGICTLALWWLGPTFSSVRLWSSITLLLDQWTYDKLFNLDFYLILLSDQWTYDKLVNLDFYLIVELLLRFFLKQRQN